MFLQIKSNYNIINSEMRRFFRFLASRCLMKIASWSRSFVASDDGKTATNESSTNSLTKRGLTPRCSLYAYVTSLSLILIFLYACCALAIVFLNMRAHENSNSRAKLSSNYILHFREREKWDLRSIRVQNLFFFFFFFLREPVFHPACPFSCEVNVEFSHQRFEGGLGNIWGFHFLRFLREFYHKKISSLFAHVSFSADSRRLFSRKPVKRKDRLPYPGTRRNLRSNLCSRISLRRYKSY